MHPQYQEAQKEILARAGESIIHPTLDRMRAAMDLLGNPQHNYRVIHVTGTNGKTSTARMIDSLLRERQLRVGRYTSPHLTSMRERIVIDGEPLSEQAFADLYADVLPYVRMVDEQHDVPMSFFEVLTVMAYAAFADAPVDVAVVEVGMGGTWDATNVVDADVAVGTPSAVDHTDYLADTPEGSVVHRNLAVGGQQIAVKGLRAAYDGIFLPLFGAHQATNAAVAVAAVEAFAAPKEGEDGLDPELVRTALSAVSSPGRLEIVRTSPTVLVDAAHNPAGMAATGEAVRESFTFDRLVGVVAVLADKDAEGILEPLEPLLDEIVVTVNSSPRALPVDRLRETAEAVFGPDRVHAALRLDDAIDQAVALAERDAEFGGGGVLITGSVVTAGDAIHLLKKE